MSEKPPGVQTLDTAIHDYLSWLDAKRYGELTRSGYKKGLNHFHDFIDRMGIPWDGVFSFETFESFKEKYSHPTDARSVKMLSRFLFKKNRLKRPIERPTPRLPRIYEEYLEHYRRVQGVGKPQVRQAWNTLKAFNHYLENRRIRLASIRIDEIDDFLAERNAKYSPATRSSQRSNTRGFLRYLYGIRGLIERDLSSLLTSPPDFTRNNPPKFLRPYEVKRLFESLPTETPKDLRTLAMLRMGYALGLRPKEIRLVRLDDISFRLGEIIIRSRKRFNPIKLPLPEIVIKAIAAYIVGGRPKSDNRELFLSLHAPHGPIGSCTVCNDISAAMRSAGLRATAYWLRHTYAQTLLESGASIYEIKEMLGHDSVDASRRYLHVHTELMRKALFDETL